MFRQEFKAGFVPLLRVGSDAILRGFFVGGAPNRTGIPMAWIQVIEGSNRGMSLLQERQHFLGVAGLGVIGRQLEKRLQVTPGLEDLSQVHLA